MNKFLKRVIEGVILGASLITTIGGGTVAVILGVYDDIITAIAEFPTKPKQSLQLIIPMGIGGVVGIVVLIIPIFVLKRAYPFIALSLFVGLTLGGFRVFKKTLKGHFSVGNALRSIIGMLFVLSLGAITWFGGFETSLQSISLLQIILLFIIGFISTGAHVSPGISGTLFLLAVGYFDELILLVKRFLFFESVNFWGDFSGLLSFAVGSVIGLFVISKMIKHLLTKWNIETNFTIVGFIIGSIIIVFFNGEIKPEYATFESFNVLQFFICISLIIGGAFLTNFLLSIAEKNKLKNEIKNEELNNAVGN